MNDASASRERTRLAWGRTALSATAVGLLAARPAFAPRAGLLAWLAAALAMAAWSALVALGYQRVRRLPHPATGTIVACAVITSGFAALGGLVVML